MPNISQGFIGVAVSILWPGHINFVFTLPSFREGQYSIHGAYGIFVLFAPKTNLVDPYGETPTLPRTPETIQLRINYVWATCPIITKPELFGIPDPKPAFGVTNWRVGRYNLPRLCIPYHPCMVYLPAIARFFKSSCRSIYHT